MTGSRPRHSITETDELATMLDDAARRWPEDRDSRPRLLVRLVTEGHRALEAADLATERRREAVRRSSGALTGVYPKGYLAALREDWPE